ncbi:MAG: YdcF family protein [Spirochaetota bacterium]
MKQDDAGHKTQPIAIVILGSPNDSDGRLSPQALSRIGVGLEAFRSQPSAVILLTGGFGPHFNNAARPHAAYARDHLMERGAPGEAFLEFALSSNTVEDALLAGPILAKAGIDRALIVSSDFHLARARFVFLALNPRLDLEFLAAPTLLPPEELARLAAHEEEALASLRRDGIRHGGKRLA